VTLTPFLTALQTSPIASGIRNSLYLFPLIEIVHVIAIGLVFGTIMIVDLRLLGLAWTGRSYDRVSSDVLKWTWGAFLLAAVTGALMFITNARVYVDNGFFRAKFALMALAGLNMLAFQLTVGRRTAEWGRAVRAPDAARAAAIASLVLWTGVIGMGRATGFATTGAAAKQAAPPANIDFDSFLNSSAPSSSAPPASK
jgi:hypothetical protein